MAIGDDAHASERQDAVVLFRSGWQHYQKARVSCAHRPLPLLPAATSDHSQFAGYNALRGSLVRRHSSADAPRRMVPEHLQAPGSPVSTPTLDDASLGSACSSTVIIVHQAVML